MPAATAHKVSASNHKLYHEALRFTTIYVYLDVAYATLLLAAALHLSGVPVGLILGLDVPLKKSEAGGEGGLVRSGALSLATAGVMGLLVGVMVRGCCRFDKSHGCVVTNWHDLLKYTHMGRTITAAMCAVLTWRGLGSLKDFQIPEGGVGLVPAVLIAAAVLSLAAAASMNFLHFRMKGVLTEYAKLKRT
ncbi:hypothetical protein Esi_0178_0031 [Ectocarpus siliculosus]|uniref:Uncharacterized protein n=1 Tax=Ectocarpus siliculosus TaxID=2880 RepID=D7FNB4_ECTSI|nr:hypothetical protein Esi_0178_0031 [Ectocarpus siliculosus]|eukprot:CBJ30171.1 hypothetical protein Esi_0178_0031 [Ectocarpus siliculosus]